MSLAALSVLALFVTVFLSCVTKLNVGVLAIAMAWIIGVYRRPVTRGADRGRISGSALLDPGRHDAAVFASPAERHTGQARS